MPDIGTDEAVELIEISVAVGDTVAEGDSLVVLESDKASMEVPAPFGGEVIELLVKAGDPGKAGRRAAGAARRLRRQRNRCRARSGAGDVAPPPRARPKRQLPPPVAVAQSQDRKPARLPRHPAVSTRAPRCASWPGNSV